MSAQQLALRFIAIVLLPVWLGACATKDVLPPEEEMEKTDRHLQVPDGLSIAMVDYYPVPGKEYVAEASGNGNPHDKGAPVILLANGDGVQVVEHETQVQLWFQDSTDNLAEVLKNFLKRKDYAAKFSQAGDEQLCETRWKVLSSDLLKDEYEQSRSADNIRARYNIRIFPAPESKTGSYLSIEQTGYQWERKSGLWEDLPLSQKATTYFANAFLSHFELDYAFEVKRKNALASLNTIKIELGTAASGHTTFLTDSEFWVVWQMLPRALERIGFDVSDYDQSLGVYYTDFSGVPEKDSSWAFWKDKAGEEIALKDGEYIVQVGLEGEQASISFLDKNNSPLGQGILAQLYTPLSDALTFTKSEH